MPETRLYAVRGATTVDADTRDQVVERTAELLRVLIHERGVAREEVVSILFTATRDIHAEFPAAAAREIGLSGVPLMCARELDVHGPLAVERCIRVMIHLYAAAQPEPAYLHDAARIRELIAPQ